MNLTVPGSSSRIDASTDATPSCTATWMSCPQAWHHAHLLSQVGGAHGRLEGVRRVLGDRKRVHVGAHRHHRTGPPAPQEAHDARVRHARAHVVEAQRAQVVGHQRRRVELAVAQLGVLMDVLAQDG